MKAVLYTVLVMLKAIVMTMGVIWGLQLFCLYAFDYTLYINVGYVLAIADVLFMLKTVLWFKQHKTVM